MFGALSQAVQTIPKHRDLYLSRARYRGGRWNRPEPGWSDGSGIENMADAMDSTVDEEIDSSRAGTTTWDGGATAAADGGVGGSFDEAAASIATRPDLIVGTRRFKLASLVASEGYNIGWSARASLAFGVPGGGASRVDILATLADRDLSPGRRGRVNLRVEAEGNEFLHNQTIRTWPCMVSRMVPIDSGDDTSAICRIELVDPIGYLASREIWGAFRDVSAAELIGGAIALAAGLEEGPTTEVATACLPRIIVRSSHRDALDVIPYAIATGEKLGDWVGPGARRAGIESRAVRGGRRRHAGLVPHRCPCPPRELRDARRARRGSS